MNLWITPKNCEQVKSLIFTYPTLFLELVLYWLFLMFYIITKWQYLRLFRSIICTIDLGNYQRDRKLYQNGYIAKWGRQISIDGRKHGHLRNGGKELMEKFKNTYLFHKKTEKWILTNKGLISNKIPPLRKNSLIKSPPN